MRLWEVRKFGRERQYGGKSADLDGKGIHLWVVRRFGRKRWGKVRTKLYDFPSTTTLGKNRVPWDGGGGKSDEWGTGTARSAATAKDNVKDATTFPRRFFPDPKVCAIFPFF